MIYKNPLEGIIKTIESTFDDLGMKHTNPEASMGCFALVGVDNTDGHPIPVMVAVDANCDHIEISLPDLVNAPIQSAPPLYEMTNRINENLGTSCFVAHRIPETSTVIVVSVKAGLVVHGKTLNKGQFKTLLQDTLQAGRNYKPLLEELLKTGASPQRLIDQFVSTNPQLFAH